MRFLAALQQSSRYIGFSFLISCCGLAYAGCPSDAAIDAYVADFSAMRESKGFGNDISAADAECAKKKLSLKLRRVLGEQVGYKAGFTNVALQQRFKVDGPRWGYMYERDMIDIQAVLPAKFGARPLYEADFIVVAKDAGLADAKTPLEALGHIEFLVPFIELPDLMLEGTFSGNAMVATNVAFRGGVLGQEIPVVKSQAFLDALANMTVVMTDENSGQELGRAKGSALMDNPINAAMWLAQDLKKNGIKLKRGDLLSLGGYVPPQPTKPGMRVQVKYIGLPGDPSVSVEFH